MEILERPFLPGVRVRPPRLAQASSRGRRTWYVALAVLLVLAIAVTSFAIVRARAGATVAYETAPVVRGYLVQSVTATGTVNAQNTIAIGSQESGTITELDVDYNAHVHRGEVLARLDPTTFQAALDQANAQLAQAQAQARATAATADGAQAGIGGADATQRASQATARAALATARANDAAVATATATIARSQSALALANQTVARDAQLFAQGYIAQSQLDADRSAQVSAQSALDSAQAGVAQAQAQAQSSASQAQASAAQSSASSYQTETAQSSALTQAATAAASRASIASVEAQVRQAQLNLQKTVITSPVDGTVVARNVAIGETVAASFQTPTLFSIAQNLSKMEVDLAVGEPDIGNVRSGDAVEFSVLAFPTTTFRGVVSQVRIAPVTTQNVVTYTVVVLVDNRAGQLLPGMTANASIHVAKAANAQIVPLAALSYQPANGATGTHHRGTHGARGGAASPSATATAMPANATTAASPWGATTGSASALVTAGSRGRIYVERGAKLVRIPVTVTLVSGAQAAVAPLRGTIEPNDLIVTGDAQPQGAAQRAPAAANPFAGGAGPGRGATRGLN